MAVKNAKVYIPKYSTDKVMRSRTITLSTPDFVGLQFNDFAPPIYTDYILVGIYSYDGGVTWNDLARYTNNALNNNPTVFISYVIYENGNVNLSIEQKALVNGGNPWNLLLKVAYVARGDQPNPGDDMFQYVTGLRYSSSQAYMKIHSEGSYPITGSNVTSIPHNLGYVPMVRAYIRKDVDVVNGYTDWQPLLTNYNSIDGIDSGVEIDENNLVIRAQNNANYPGKIYWRIYYEGS